MNHEIIDRRGHLKVEIPRGESVKIFFTSDNHIDSRNCELALMKKHFDLAKSLGAYIVIVGDFFDLMQGKFDKRKHIQGLHPDILSIAHEHDIEYSDAVIMYGYNFLKPYAENLLMIGYGNHETKYNDINGTDIINNLVHRLNVDAGSPVKRGRYEGYINLNFQQERVIRVKYHHGTRTNAQRTKGILESQMDSWKYPDADLIVKGDNHQKYQDFNIRERIGRDLRTVFETQTVLRIGPYKQKTTGGLGWEVEKGFGGSPLGGWLTEIYVEITDERTKAMKDSPNTPKARACIDVRDVMTMRIEE